jgi:trans-aconitate methyltransferase
MYNYLLGGADNGPADRKVIDQVLPLVPELPLMAWANRAFHQRAAIWMARQGITQFIEIGCGLPERDPTHLAVQDDTPVARVAYVDIDPYVVARTCEQLPEDPTTIAIIQGDVRDPEALLTDPALSAVIDLSQPCGLLLTAVMHFVSDTARPHDLTARLCSSLAPGSCLALSHATADAMPPAVVAMLSFAYDNANARLHLRTKADIERCFAGLDILPPYCGAEPGACRVGLWGCEDPEAARDESSQALWCAVARRP